MSDEFPRPCKNCGNPVMMHEGKLVHVRRKSVNCRVIANVAFERDSEGKVCKMLFGRPIPIPDPPTKEQRQNMETQAALSKLEEWNKLYARKP